MVLLYLYILASANVEDAECFGRIVKKGQLITSLRTIKVDNPNMSMQTIRTCLKKLQDYGEIDIESTKLYTVVTICNSEVVLQDAKKEKMSESSEEFTLTPEPVIKEPPKKTKEQILADTQKRMDKFYKSLVPFVGTYGKEMIREFYDYWSETNKSLSMMRWETEKTWCLERRLNRWASNNKNYSNEKNRTDNETRQRLEGAANVVNRFLSEN